MIGGDLVLNTLSKIENPIGVFVSQFLNNKNNEDMKWLDEWFRTRVQFYFDFPQSHQTFDLDIDSIDFVSHSNYSAPTKLVSIDLNYFRGFQKLEIPVSLQGDLIVLDGSNSSGKTSLAEAIEWLLTGHIVRRDTGDPKEFAECITNKFRPSDSETWVELVLAQGDHTHVVRRKLLKDYDSRKNTKCETVLIYNGEELAPEQTLFVVEQFFSGVLPLLMQHTLRLFVHDNPDKRRDYFERLLSLDRITTLVEKSVVSDVRFSDFPSESGSITLQNWNALKEIVTNRNALKRVEQTLETRGRDVLQEALTIIATEDFGLDTNLTFDELSEKVRDLQKSVRQDRFPLLERLRPKRTLDQVAIYHLSSDFYNPLLETYLKAQTQYKSAQASAKTISQAELAIAKSLQDLINAGLISQDIDIQTCPLCDYQQTPTLSSQRINEVSVWEPIQKAITKSKIEYQNSIAELISALKALIDLRYDLLPHQLSVQERNELDHFTDVTAVVQLVTTLNDANIELQVLDTLCDNVFRINSKEDNPEILNTLLQSIFGLFPKIIEHTRVYTARFSEFENYISAVAGQDMSYVIRELWLTAISQPEVLLADLAWENAKKKAQKELVDIRGNLILLRQKYLDSRRVNFNTGVSEIWKKLREDRYSAFDKLFIPEPRGRGFPIKIEVKALLDNNSETREVDALSVFSESQINAVGIAAFMTRSNLIGHKCLIFDDPVQSMDEDHYKTFANQVLSYLCDEGFQVIVLTHSDQFARDISYVHSDREQYVTMELRHSRRKGCQIEEGNRRVSERLNRAEKLADEGNLSQAWIFVRKAIERFYLLIQKKYGPPAFKPASWANHTAENMWNEGVGAIFEAQVPNYAKRMREILTMCSSGAHDKSPEANTNLMNAIADIRPLLTKLQIGG